MNEDNKLLGQDAPSDMNNNPAGAHPMDGSKPDPNEETQFSLNDDRRVRTLSPGALVLRRFLRNRVAVTGLIILAFMFVFSFIGGAITPYKEDQLFYRNNEQKKQYAAIKENTEYRYTSAEGAKFPSVAQAKFVMAAKKNAPTFEAGGTTYSIVKEGEDFYGIYSEDGSELIAVATFDVVTAAEAGAKIPFGFQFAILKAVTNDAAQEEAAPAEAAPSEEAADTAATVAAAAAEEPAAAEAAAEEPAAAAAEAPAAVPAASGGDKTFEYEGKTYTVTEDGTVLDGDTEIAYASRYVVQPIMSDVHLTKSFKAQLLEAIEAGNFDFVFTDEDGTTAEYTIDYDAANKSYSVMQIVETRVFDTYHEPTKEHPLGTDRNGMDMLTRLMYGGRVSLYIGFIVVFIESVIGVILGGLSGYCGGWVDNLIMRIVDIFYCIPSMPIIIILGAAMDALHVDPQIRMIYLMLILGFLGWPGIARMVRGQILSLREQEFMTAAEATGIRASRRIFRHLIPNVIPQLIVTMTMSLGSTIITEATLSFLGLGVKFPFASWGNIINDVNDTYVLTNYWFIWIPAGVCLLATVLAFNLVGDGLRDAFDPKMKR